MRTRISVIATAPCRGFTLVEAVISVLLVSVMLVASLNTVGAFARSRNIRQDESRSLLLAQQLMGEIVQCAYADPSSTGTSYPLGPENSETRPTYNDVDDYNGYSQTTPTTKTGLALTGFSGWKRTVKVEFFDPATLAVATSDKGLKRITVTVTSPTNKTTKLVALRAKYGLYEHTLTTPTAFNSWVDIYLQAGSDTGARVYSGVDTVNQVP
jgi:MSHA pilin protein MshD